MPTLLADLARSVGVTLGRISRQFSGPPAARRSTHSQSSTSLGATENQVNMHATLPERIDRFGTKVEDLGGTGAPDALGG